MGYFWVCDDTQSAGAAANSVSDAAPITNIVKLAQELPLWDPGRYEAGVLLWGRRVLPDRGRGQNGDGLSSTALFLPESSVSISYRTLPSVPAGVYPAPGNVSFLPGSYS